MIIVGGLAFAPITINNKYLDALVVGLGVLAGYAASEIAYRWWWRRYSDNGDGHGD